MICRFSIKTLFLCILFVCSGNAQTADLDNEFQQLLDTYHKKYSFPGATAALILPSGKLVKAATGLADIRTNTPMTNKSRMLAASIGKTFVSAAVLTLINDRRIALDDPISNWLAVHDWFTRLPNYNTITVRHLLNHRSGLPDHVYEKAFRIEASKQWRGPDNPFSPTNLVGFILDKSPLFEAGQGWAYSDTGYILLGMIIESITGRDYFEVIRMRFIKPLKLQQTSPSNSTNLEGLATGYMSAANAFGFPPETTSSLGIMAWNPGVEWTGGGFVSTARDLAVWGKALFEGRAMNFPYLHELLAAIPIDPNHQDIAYSLGVAIYQNGPFGPVYGHGGWIPGYSSSLRYYPKYGISIAFQINTDIGIVDDSTTLIKELEQKLAEFAIGAIEISNYGT